MPGALRGRPGRGHTGPGRGRGRLRHHRAGRGRDRRHGGPAGRGAAAGRVAGAARDLDERVPGTHDGRGRARPGGGVPRRLRQVGRQGGRDRRGNRHRAAGHDLARRAGGGHPGRHRGRWPGLRPTVRPARRPGRAGRQRPGRAAPPGRAGLRADLLALLASPGLVDKSWVTDQYDRYVRGDTVLAMPEDAGLVRVDEATGLGIALATDGNGRYCRLDPYRGTQLALSEAYRNVAATGARPLAVTNCLNFGSPEDPAVMWQFAEATRGLADACLELGVPVTGGNVSFYNQTGATAIHPTPVVGVLGVVDDVTRR